MQVLDACKTRREPVGIGRTCRSFDLPFSSSMRSCNLTFNTVFSEVSSLMHFPFPIASRCNLSISSFACWKAESNSDRFFWAAARSSFHRLEDVTAVRAGEVLSLTLTCESICAPLLRGVSLQAGGFADSFARVKSVLFTRNAPLNAARTYSACKPLSTQAHNHLDAAKRGGNQHATTSLVVTSQDR